MQLSTVRAELSGSSVWKMRPWALSLGIYLFSTFSTSRISGENLHPASVVRPSGLETGKDGQNRGPTSSATRILGLSARWREVGAGIIV